jgi:flagellar biosynthesis/type III secretory pathway protein FliH
MSYSWTRSFSYWFGNYDEYKTDQPREKEVSLKAVLMKQIVLSRLRLNKIKTIKQIPYDLQKIEPSKIKINMDDYKIVKKEIKKEFLIAAPWTTLEIPEKPVLKRQRVEKSQKQQQHILSYTDRMKMLKSTL